MISLWDYKHFLPGVFTDKKTHLVLTKPIWRNRDTWQDISEGCKPKNSADAGKDLKLSPNYIWPELLEAL